MPLSPDFLIVNVLLGIVWLYFFLRAKSTRMEMLTIGIVAVLFTPLFLFLGAQQTLGTIGFADIVFSFFVAGISAVIFQAVFGKHYRVRHPLRLFIKKPTNRWFLQLLLIATLWAWLSIFFLLLLKTDALQSVIASGLLIGSYVIASRKDLFWDAIWSAILMMIVFFLLYTIAFLRGLPGTEGPYLLAIPNIALLWAGMMGFVLGPLYEYVRGMKLSGPR